jgi:hypothetical protein
VPLQPVPNRSGITFSAECNECLVALEWGIRLRDWFAMPREERAKHIATVEAKYALMNPPED